MSSAGKINHRQVLDTLCVENTHHPRVPVDHGSGDVIDFAAAVRAIREGQCRASSVSARAMDAQVLTLTAKYQPLVEQQVDILCPGLKKARQDLVESITREFVDRELFT